MSNRGLTLKMALKRFLNPEKGIVRRSEGGPVLDSLRIKPMPLRVHFSPGGFPLSISLGAFFEEGGEKEWRGKIRRHPDGKPNL